MSLVAKGKKTYCAVARVVRSIWKYVMRLLTRQGELERSIRRAIAYDRGGFSADLVKAIAISLARSVQLASLKQDVFGKKPFSARKLARLIAEQKGMRDDAVIAILTWCLRVLSTVNSVHERVGELQRQSYDASNPAHVALLDSLWESLMPDTRRTDWAPLGFQNGSKPESDLRGMGMLALHQLVFFAQRRNREATRILADSTNPKRYFPFAAAGVNITAFTMTMLGERRLDGRIYDAVANLMQPGDQTDSSPDDEMLVAAGLTAFNDFYGEEYMEFSRFWHASLPESTMAFPGIFGTIKQRSVSRFPPIIDEE
ncbi:unnamed protein product [Ascophyllum nodosum]